MSIAMKRTLPMLIIAAMVICLFSCSARDLADMRVSVTDDYAAVVWDGRTYVPYGALAAYGDRGKQIGIVDGDKKHKVYECKGYSSDEWIVTALPHDPAMLLREINVEDIPDGWRSEYEWNK